MAEPYVTLSKKNKPKEGDRYPLVLKIHFKGRPLTRQLAGVYIPEEFWDEKAMKVFPGLKDDQGNNYSEFCNLQIGKALGKANEILRRYWVSEEIELNREIFGREYDNEGSRGDFLEYWKKCMASDFNRRVFAKPTLNQHERTLRKIEKKFGEYVAFNHICRRWLEEFDEWHAKQLKNNGYDGRRERQKAIKHISRYLKRAKGEGKKFQNPFEGFVMPKYKSRPVYLEEDIVQQILFYYRNPHEVAFALSKEADRREMTWHHKEQFIEFGVPKIIRVARCKLFQCITGMRDSDLQAVTHEDNIEGKLGDGYLVFVPIKTQETSGALVRQKITPLMRELIVTNRGPLIETWSNQKYNDHLKELGAILSTNKKLTTHVGRHTYATLSLQRGIHLEVLKELMGLTSIETLMKYVHVSDKRRDREQMAAWENFGV